MFDMPHDHQKVHTRYPQHPLAIFHSELDYQIMSGIVREALLVVPLNQEVGQRGNLRFEHCPQ